MAFLMKEAGLIAPELDAGHGEAAVIGEAREHREDVVDVLREEEADLDAAEGGELEGAVRTVESGTK